MANLPQRLDLGMMQTTWAATLDPIIASPATNPTILKNIPLGIGTNVINHKLGRTLQAWTVIRKRAAANIHDQQDANQMPQLTLILVSDAVVTVDLEVY